MYHGRALGVWPRAVQQYMLTSKDTARSSSCAKAICGPTAGHCVLAAFGNGSHGPGCASSLLQAPLTSCVTLLALAALSESEARPEHRDNSFLRISPNVKSAMTKTGASPDRFSGALARKGWSPTAIEADSGRHTRSSTLLAELAETTRDDKLRRRVITRIAATPRSSCGASTPHCRAVW